jgi:hypothetical protein
MFQNSLSRRRLIALAGAGALGMAVGPELKAQPANAAFADAYELIDLGITAPEDSMGLGAISMNRHGVIAGSMYVDDQKNAPWFSENGTIVRIKTGKYGARVAAINDNGVIAGREILGWHSPDQAFGRPVYWIDGEKFILPYPEGLPGNVEEGMVRALTNNDLIVGSVSITGGNTYPVAWRNGEPELLEVPDGHTRGSASLANDRGLIFGDVTGTEDVGGGGFWRDGRLEIMSVNPPPGINRVVAFVAVAMDPSGRLAGSLQTEETMYAGVVQSDGKTVDVFTTGHRIE